MLTGLRKALIALGRAGAAAMVAAAVGIGANGSVVLAKEPAMSVTKSAFGKLPDGAQVDLYTLKNAHGVTVRIMTYGGIITSLKAPDRRGQPGEIQLGFDSLDEYLAGHPYLRRRRRPRRQPHRQGEVHARRQDNTSWPPTTARTICTAASKVSTR